MSAIEYQLPDPRHVELHRIFVKAKPEAAWQAARHGEVELLAVVEQIVTVTGGYQRPPRY